MKTFAIIALATVIAAPAFAQSGTRHHVNTRAHAQVQERAQVRHYPQQQQTQHQLSTSRYNAFNSTSYNRTMQDEPWNDDSETGE